MPHSLPYALHEAEGFAYLDEGPAHVETPVMLLHGMLGDLSNWSSTIGALAEHGHRVIVPKLPVYDLPIRKTSVPGLTRYVRRFVEAMQLPPVVLVGNSLGGHVALLYGLDYPADVSAMVLSGASGIYEVQMGTTVLRRQDRDFIRERAALTFYEDDHVTDDLVEEMYEIVNNRGRALRLIKMARSAEHETVTDELHRLAMPTLLVWGRDDVITPPGVADEFKARLPQAELHFIDQCGHAPMIEHPERFNELMLNFLEERAWVELTPEGAS
jgi:pimeloyl-ACP methyl ester carboxylesterase